MSRSKSSHRWLQEHFQDEYVKRARSQGLRSRAVFKLMEIQERDRLLKPGMNVLDLGAAPGGWSVYARQMVGKKAKVIALDILPMEVIPGVDCMVGDFRDDEVLEQLYRLLDGIGIDIVLSDMAPNISGNREVDQPRAVYLAELALDAARTVLTGQGKFLVKVFQGEGFDAFLQEVRQSFAKVLIRKPKASRSRSSEVYILGLGFKK